MIVEFSEEFKREYCAVYDMAEDTVEQMLDDYTPAMLLTELVNDQKIWTEQLHRVEQLIAQLADKISSKVN